MTKDNNRLRERALFDSLKDRKSGKVCPHRLLQAIDHAGLEQHDPRLQEVFTRLEALREQSQGVPQELGFEEFRSIISLSVLLLERAFKQELVIPDFQEFKKDVTQIFAQAKHNADGEVANYIPQLGRVNPELFGVAVCTIDGQRFKIGDADTSFCVQSSTKPMKYCLALEEHGEERVHAHIGCEPSGHAFNELTLNDKGLPHNPMINAGAIMSCSLIKSNLTMADRFDYVLDKWQAMMGGVRPGFSNPTYLSERLTADRNFALGYSMRENRAFPENCNLIETLEFYFQCCSLEVTANNMAVLAATLANGGVCPTTGVRVLQAQTVQKCLSFMYSCGMYDFSGEWAFRIGLPAKSGVSGVIMTVIPNVMGIVSWSPKLDKNGNSVRGIEFCRQLVNTFNFHNYDNIVGGLHGKKDPRVDANAVRRNLGVDLCWAASEGDLAGIKRLLISGASLDDADYDGRTALHLAAAEGQLEVVRYFLDHGIKVSPKDRWGNTPFDDAVRAGHKKVANLLQTRLEKQAGREIKQVS